MDRRRSSPTRLIDVAEKAGVSLTTASFAMTGRPGVSEAVAERVRVIAAELGYVPNVQARALASGASSSLGLIVHNVADPYFGEIASAVVQYATDLGLTVQISQSSRDPAREFAQVRALVASRVRGIIMAGSGAVTSADWARTYEELERFQATGGRVAMIGRHRAPLDAVVPDNKAGGLLIGSHVRDLGHLVVGIVAGPEGLASASDRLDGVRQALGDRSGIAVRVRHAPFTHAGGAMATEELLAERPDITALMALNDSMAAGALTALRIMGRAVPADTSVTGFDDVSVAADLGPGLTTVRLPLQLMGITAVRLALKKPVARPQRVTVGAELVVRGSTARPRDAR